MTATLKDALYGQAVGDALGVPFEFKARGAFHCTGMVGHGTHDKPAGTWSDDTSMALTLSDSLRINKSTVDIGDIRERFIRWYKNGDYTVDGLFDVGGTTATALEMGYGGTDEQDNGNGSLMRTIPLAFTNASDDEIRAVSAITHAHPISTEACVRFVHYARNLLAGETPAEALHNNNKADCLRSAGENEVNSGGFVLDTYRAALWCLINTHTYAECVLKAVNLGADTDTTAAVAGALAGIVYGLEGIPAEWIEVLRGKDVIEGCLF